MMQPDAVGDSVSEEDRDVILAAASRQAQALAGVTPKPRRTKKWRPAHRDSGLSGARADGRDPKSVGATLSKMIVARGWRRNVTIGGIETKWDELVGEQIAANSKPESFTDGTLTIRTRSTTWANQLKWMQQDLLTKIQQALGEELIDDLKIVGPVAPSWSKGPLRVKGRGPRDTYG